MSSCCRWMPPCTMPAMTDRPRMNVVDIYEPYIVPHIHPTHTQYRHHKVIQHRHYYPSSVSQTCDVCEQHVNCGCPPPNPCC